MHPQNLKINDFTYQLPTDKIAQYPLAERDASKLLIYKDGSITESVYKNIADSLPQSTLMVFNNTKVIHARLLFRKPTGGVIEIFCLSPNPLYPDIQTAMLQKKLVLWQCMIGGAGKWKNGLVLQLPATDFTVKASIKDHTPLAYTICFEWDKEDITFAEVLHLTGKMPLPPYMKRDAENTDEDRYQTIFAIQEGSVAAPTAGLHFTTHILDSLKHKNIQSAYLSLHVGAGTFRPVKSLTMQDHPMHEEWIEVSMATLQQLIDQPIMQPIIAVGTTSLRTIESLYWIGNKLANGIDLNLQEIAVTQWEPYNTQASITYQESLGYIKQYMLAKNIPQLVTRTQILIAPGYRFRIINGLVTNFHQPQSTLLLLVAALIGDDWKKVYDYALQNNFRFLSYGDGCLLFGSPSI